MLELSLNKNLNCWQCKLKKTRCKLDAHKVQADRILGQQKMRNVTNISSFLSFCLVPVCFIEFRDENDNLRNHDKSVAHTRTERHMWQRGEWGNVARCNAEYFPLQDTLLGPRESPACFWARFHLPSWL